MTSKMVIASFNEGYITTAHLWTLAQVVGAVLAIIVLKRYCQGAKATADRNMHGKVVMITVSAEPSSAPVRIG